MAQFGDNRLLPGARLSRRFGLAEVGNIDEGQHHAINTAIHSAIGEDAQLVPPFVAALSLTFMYLKGVENAPGKAGKAPVVQLMGDVRKGAPYVSGQQVEQLGCPRRVTHHI